MPACTWWIQLEGIDELYEPSMLTTGGGPGGVLPRRPMTPSSTNNVCVESRSYCAVSVSPTPKGLPMIGALYRPTSYWPSPPYVLLKAPTVAFMASLPMGNL